MAIEIPVINNAVAFDLEATETINTLFKPNPEHLLPGAVVDSVDSLRGIVQCLYAEMRNALPGFPPENVLRFTLVQARDAIGTTLAARGIQVIDVE